MASRSLRRPWAIVLAVALVAGACGSTPASPVAPSPSELGAVATPTTTLEPAPSPTPSPSPTASPTPQPTQAPSPTASPEATASPEPTDDGPETLSSGRTGKVGLPAYGMTLTLPKGWKTVGLTEDEIRAMMRHVPEGTIPAGMEDQVMTLVANGLRLLAVDTRRANLGASLNVTVVDYVIPVALMRSAAELGLDLVKGVRDPKIREVTIDGVDGLRVDYGMDIVGGKGVDFTATQIWIPRPGGTALVTVTIPKGGRTADRDSIVRSLRLD